MAEAARIDTAPAVIAEATLAGLAQRKAGRNAYRQQRVEMFWNSSRQEEAA